MVNQYENTILTLNKFNWIVAIGLGVILLIVGIVDSALTFGIAGGYEIFSGIVGIIAGVLGKMKVVEPINQKKFEEIWMTLLIVAIIGVIGYGTGVLFLIQAILIKVGGK